MQLTGLEEASQRVLGVFLTTAGNLGSAPAILAYVRSTVDLQSHC